MTRRIKKPLSEFFDTQSLTAREKSFILGCMRFQELYPQLTNKQWKVVCDIEKRYRNGNNKGYEETSER